MPPAKFAWANLWMLRSFSLREIYILFYTLLNKREETFLMQSQIFREIAHRYVLKIGIEKWHWKYHPVSDFTNFSSNLHEKRCRFDEILQFSVILTNFFVLICKIWFQYHQLLFTFSLLKNVCFFSFFLYLVNCRIIQLPTIRSGGIDFTIPQPARLGFASTLGLPDGKINATLTYGW